MHITRNAHGDEAVPGAPVKGDGSLYTYELIAGSQRVYADTPGELLGYLIPGYTDAPNGDAAFIARLRHSLGVAARIQAVINDLYESTERTVEEHDLLFAGGGAPVNTWDSKVPIVLVDCMYAPYTELPRPQAGEGHIVWLEPLDEFDYLVSLHAVGAVAVNMTMDRAI